MEFRLLSYLGEKGTPRAGLLLEDKNIMDIELALGLRKASPEGLHPTSVLSVVENWESVFRLSDIAKNNRKMTPAVVGSLSKIRLAAPLCIRRPFTAQRPIMSITAKR
jgi:hypothetical protein